MKYTDRSNDTITFKSMCTKNGTNFLDKFSLAFSDEITEYNLLDHLFRTLQQRYSRSVFCSSNAYVALVN